MKSIFVLFLLILCGCGESETPNEPSHNYDAKEVWPLAIGNYWKFLKINYAWPSPPDTYETYIEKDTILENERVFVFHDYSNSIDKEIHSYVNREDGFHYLIYNTEIKKSEDRFILKYPCKVGEIYNKTNEYNYIIVANTNLDVMFENSVQKGILYIYNEIDSIHDGTYDYIRDSIVVIPGIGIINNKTYRSKHDTNSMELASERILIDYKINK